MRLYIETSVLVAYERGPGDSRSLTGEFFRRTKRLSWELVTSDITVREIRGFPPRLQARLPRLIPILGLHVWQSDQRVRDLAARYVEAGIIPTNVELDAQHIAAATILRLDALVSWNLRHIVNLRTKIGVQRLNSEQGLHTPNLVRPDEVT